MDKLTVQLGDSLRRFFTPELRWFWLPTFAFVITRIGIFLIAYLASPLITDSAIPAYHLRPDNIVLDVLGSRWDTGFYLSIAQEGYTYPAEEFSSVPFFPLFPIFIRLMTAVIGDPVAAGILLANLALWGACIVLYKFVIEQHGSSTADRAVWYLLIFPASIFGSAIYSESFFLLTSILAFYLAYKSQWFGAALSGMLAALTRLMGIILLPALIAEWIKRWRTRDLPQKPAWLGLFFTLFIPLGTVIYSLYLYTVFGDGLAFVRASADWGRTPGSPIQTTIELFQQPVIGWKQAILSGQLPLDNLIDFFFVASFFIMGIILLMQKRWAEGIFVLTGVIIGLSSGLLMSQRRYMWSLFPVFILLAQWGKSPLVDRIIWVFFLLGLGLFTALFANWYWVG